MIVYQTNAAGIFIGPTTADPNPLTPGEFLIPGGCVTTAPPTSPIGFRARWTGAAWLLEDEDTGEVIAPGGPTPEQLRAGMSLSRRQMLIALATEQLITPAEAEAWATSNSLPNAIETMVSGLSDPLARMAARITLASFAVAQRLDPMVPMLAAVAPVPLTDAQLDAFFTGYAGI